MNDWCKDPCLAPPFSVLGFGEGLYTIVDQEGRQFMFDLPHKKFVHELASVMNENKDRLLQAWKKDINEGHCGE